MNRSAGGGEVELPVLNLPLSGLSEAFAGAPQSLVLVLTQAFSYQSTKMYFPFSFFTLVKKFNCSCFVGESAGASLLPWKLYPAPIACYLFPVLVTWLWMGTYISRASCKPSCIVLFPLSVYLFLVYERFAWMVYVCVSRVHLVLLEVNREFWSL